ncbi:MAG TPA: ABC transporter permease [Patescibacteria group bacterium]|nr:ABC transporter permease [Patescibacteria group bacterium]
MNTPSDVATGSRRDSLDITFVRMPATRRLSWSIRRELWENRSVTIAPLAVAAFILFVFLITIAVASPRRMRTLPTLGPAAQHALVVRPFCSSPGPIMMVTILIGIFYALDALYGERRDRSILFWKSLPVSDLETVLSKAAIPLAVLPLIGFALSVATQIVLLLWSTVVLSASGLDPGRVWAEFHFIQTPLVMLYGTAVFTLWHAPLYCWLLLVSGWARRMPVLWAALPFVAVGLVERVAFGTTYFGAWMRDRIMGAMPAAFDYAPPATRGAMPLLDRLDQLDPVKFAGTPGLWIGLIVAMAFLAAAVRLRRFREPL